MNDRIEIYNYKNKDDFEAFRNATVNNDELLKCFDDPDEDLDVSVNSQSNNQKVTQKNKNNNCLYVI